MTVTLGLSMECVQTNQSPESDTSLSTMMFLSVILMSADVKIKDLMSVGTIWILLLVLIGGVCVKKKNDRGVCRSVYSSQFNCSFALTRQRVMIHALTRFYFLPKGLLICML